MIQNALEENKMDKVIVYMWTKRGKVKWRVLAERGNVLVEKIHKPHKQSIQLEVSQTKFARLLS